MTGGWRRGPMIAALALAVVALVGSVTLVAAAASRSAGRVPVTGPMRGLSVMGPSMMGASMMGQVWLAGDGVAVSSIASARARAAQVAGLHPGEVIWFDNGFYVELKDSSGRAATEVIVDPATGAVSTEPGPAMMWNTRSGLPAACGGSGTPAVSAGQAQRIAARWLAANRPGRAAAAADAYPGYYTVETTVGGRIEGMLSVNTSTGAVWPHTWHGRFLAKEDR